MVISALMRSLDVMIYVSNHYVAGDILFYPKYTIDAPFFYGIFEPWNSEILLFCLDPQKETKDWPCLLAKFYFSTLKSGFMQIPENILL